MISAEPTFTIINNLTPIITYGWARPLRPWPFGQYIIARLFALPLILRIGVSKLRTRYHFLPEACAFP